MGNAYGALIDLYTTNFMNAVRVHRKKNINKFLRVKAQKHNNSSRTEIMKKHLEMAISKLFRPVRVIAEDSIYYVNILMSFVCEAGGPGDNNLAPLFTTFSWFRAVPMLIYMQREIEEYNLEKAEMYEQGLRFFIIFFFKFTNLPFTSKTNNSLVFPLSMFHRFRCFQRCESRQF